MCGNHDGCKRDADWRRFRRDRGKHPVRTAASLPWIVTPIGYSCEREPTHPETRQGSLVNRQALTKPMIRTGMNPAKTQNPAVSAALAVMPSTNPEALAAIPVAAAPTL